MARTCRRSTCHRPAVASLTFRYDSAEVHLEDLAPESHPQRWELCPTHAGRLTVPRGWAVVDDRSPEAAVAAEPGPPADGPAAGARPAGAVPAEGVVPAERRVPQRSTRADRPGPPMQTGGCAGGSRYAALQAELPRLAAELALAGQLSSPAVRQGEGQSQADGDGQAERPVDAEERQAERQADADGVRQGQAEEGSEPEPRRAPGPPATRELGGALGADVPWRLR